jgi:hypothetical protein
MKNFDKETIIEFLVLAGKRALWTFSEVALSMIVLGMPFSTIDWKAIFDVALTATVISLLKSIVVSMPEFSSDGSVMINDTSCQVNLGIDEQTVKNRKSIRLKVVPDTNQK